MAIDLLQLKSTFIESFGREPRLFRAPGRVNLIGEHTDYNDGFVLPMAIENETIVAAAARDDRKIRVRSLNVNAEQTIDLDAPEQKLRGNWIDFVEGVARILERESVRLKGADLLVYSDVPTGAGLSSSAALEMSVGLALSEISGQTVDRVKLALAGQAAEHEFVGAKVGIMDQFISAMGEKDHALLIDCRSLEAAQIPFVSEDLAVVICDTNVKHELSSSEYNVRRAECEEGVRILQTFIPGVVKLRDVGVEDFEKYQSNLPEVIKKRCRHVVTEIDRTLSAAASLRQSDFTEFGRLMWLSHESLRDDYEVSSRELDLMVEIAGGCAGVLGARMTGGGFGGSTVSLVRRDNLEDFKEKISAEYYRRTQIETNIYVSRPADGAGEILQAAGDKG